jgi:hypothetical protein
MPTADKPVQHPIRPPWSDPCDWVNVRTFAKLWNRTPACVRLWCVNGTLAEFGIQCYRDPRGYWWIKKPR